MSRVGVAFERVRISFEPIRILAIQRQVGLTDSRYNSQTKLYSIFKSFTSSCRPAFNSNLSCLSAAKIDLSVLVAVRTHKRTGNRLAFSFSPFNLGFIGIAFGRKEVRLAELRELSDQAKAPIYGSKRRLDEKLEVCVVWEADGGTNLSIEPLDVKREGESSLFYISLASQPWRASWKDTLGGCLAKLLYNPIEFVGVRP